MRWAAMPLTCSARFACGRVCVNFRKFKFCKIRPCDDNAHSRHVRYRSRACATQIFYAFISFSGCHALTQKAFFVSYLNKKSFRQKNLLVGVTSWCSLYVPGTAAIRATFATLTGLRMWPPRLMLCVKSCFAVWRCSDA